MKRFFNEVIERIVSATFLPDAEGNRDRASRPAEEGQAKPPNYDAFDLADVGVEVPDGFTEQDALELRDAYWMMNSGLFGTVERRIRPLSRQLRQDIKASFPIDRPFYDDLDSRSFKVSRYLVVAYTINTVVLFAVVKVLAGLLVPWIVSLDGSPGMAADYTPNVVELWFWQFGDGALNPAWALQDLRAFLPVAIGTVLGAALLVRWVFRIWLLSEINQNINYIEVETKRLHGDMLAAVGTRLKQINDARTQRKGWPACARQYLILALWQTKRAEYFDRYSTVFDWKLQQFFERSEIGFVVLQWAVMLPVFVAMAERIMAATGAWPGFAFWVAFGLFAVFYYAAFFVTGRRTNDTWGKRIGNSIDHQEHPFLDVATTVEGLIQNIKDVERSNTD